MVRGSLLRLFLRKMGAFPVGKFETYYLFLDFSAFILYTYFKVKKGGKPDTIDQNKPTYR
ncbi:MAG TPA: hypothetical protein DCZ94_20130 [Lentisphaeria bacterium]|nr:MAG: hypothetical protein A2X48_14775 [Lentisphaerae bacterium GWF2_49_21]HBC89255.1 hypothetical protein [Lentisphaeria bacterium]